MACGFEGRGMSTHKATSKRSSTPQRGLGSTDTLVPEIYVELRALAAGLHARAPGESLSPTDIVHEAYLRLSAAGGGRCRSRTHFFALAARAMRQILADHARARRAAKRGGGWRRVTLGAIAPSDPGTDVDLVALDEALSALTRLNERHARIVELRYLAGLTISETAVVLDVSEDTVKLDGRTARAWLLRLLRREDR